MPRQGQFQKGRAKTGGRKKGTPNKLPTEGREFLKSILADPVYQASFRERAQTGELSGTMEQYMWQMICGKPAEAPENLKQELRVIFGGRYRTDGSMD